MSENATGSPLTLDIARTGGVVVVRCNGRLVAGVTNFFYTEVSKMIPGSSRIVLDLTELTQMDSMGLGSIVRLWASVKAARSELELINMGKRVRELFGITNLLSVFSAVGENGIKMQ